MEKLRERGTGLNEKQSIHGLDEAVESVARRLGFEDREKIRKLEDIARRYEAALRKKYRRRKWFGGGLIVLGMALLLSTCPFYAFSLIGPETVLAALAMILGGGVSLALKPKMKATTQALLIAAKNENALTTTRLALEMDIKFSKAEKIIQELVRMGIAEIDLDHKDPGDGLVYKIKGLG
jgi:hypothetical protein